MSNRLPLEIMTADEILSTKYPEPRWAVPNLLPAGLTILAGAPKAGKSWLALQIAHAVASGGVLLGENVTQGPVLYLALEDPPRRLQERMARQAWPEGLDAHFLPLGRFVREVHDLAAGGADMIAQAIDAKGYRFVAIDTFSRAFIGDQKDEEIMTRALIPLQRIAQATSCANMLVDHHRKGLVGDSSDLIRDLLGSTAKAAMADTIWGLYRERGKRGAKLEITGREVEDRVLNMTFDTESCMWVMADSQGRGVPTPKQQAIVEVVKNLGAANGAQIAKAIDGDKGNVHGMLQDLVEVGHLRREGTLYSVRAAEGLVQLVQPLQPDDQA